MQRLLRSVMIIVAILNITTNEVLASDDELMEIHPVSLEAISELIGLDDQTLAVASATPQQRHLIIQHLKTFIKRNRPKLLTYRALWFEALERFTNLKASVAKNAFDPCLFVTDEALEKARLSVQNARGKFEQQCRMASDGLDSFLEQNQCDLVKNARSNYGLPAPYRWLSLDEECRNQIKRFYKIYQARVALAQKYQHLKSKISQKDLEDQITAILTDEQLAALGVLRGKIRQIESISKKGDNR